MKSDTFKTFIHGMIFGIAHVIPGVSGATIAVILGFFETLIDSINNFTKDYKKHLSFLIAMLLFASLISYLLENQSFITTMFFVGLIAGSIPLIYSKINNDKDTNKLSAKDIVVILIPFLLLVLMSNLKAPNSVNPEELIKNIDLKYMIFIFIAGILSSSAMIIPGISGSFILLMMGLYPLVVYCASQILHILGDITNITLIIEISKVIVPLGLGCLVGILLISRLISILLEKYNRLTYLIILGLILGSIYVLFNDPITYQSGLNIIIVIFGVFTATIGYFVANKLGK